MSFHIGQNVICIEDTWSGSAESEQFRHLFVFPKQGAVYTVRSIGSLLDGRPFVQLAEISVFTAMLDPDRIARERERVIDPSLAQFGWS